MTSSAPSITPRVHPDLGAHAARFSQKIVKSGERTHTYIGYNIASVTIIEAPEGLILVDGMAQETNARETAAVIEQQFGRPIKAVIYTHFHNDHVNGIQGFIDAEDVAAGTVQVWAHDKLMHFVTAVSAGTGPIMGRRASYTFGAALPRGEEGFVHAGLGLPHNPGPRGFIAPTNTVSTRTKVSICGLDLELIPIPSETDDHLGVYLPGEKIFLSGDCIQGETYPNIYTLRGTPYRDPMQWVATLDWMRFELGAEIIVPHHGHPIVGKDEIEDVLCAHRDAIQFTHDQTLRYMNQGLTPDEIVQIVKFPPHLQNHHWLGEFYGTLKHCIPAIYQGKLGWFTGDPIALDPMPRPEKAKRTIALMGGSGQVQLAAKQALADGEPLWAAELVGYLVSIAPDDQDYRSLKAACYRDWAYDQSNPNWRNWALSCAMELDPVQEDQSKKQLVMAPPAVVRAFPPANILRGLTSRLKAEETEDLDLSLTIKVSDMGTTFGLHIRKGVCQFSEPARPEADLELELDRDFFVELVTQKIGWIPAINQGRIQAKGELDTFKRFFSSFEPPMAPQNINLVSR